MGAPQAATKLVLMDPEARNSIIESMAPRAAANTLTSMEDALQNIMSQPGSPEVCDMLWSLLWRQRQRVARLAAAGLQQYQFAADSAGLQGGRAAACTTQSPWVEPLLCACRTR